MLVELFTCAMLMTASLHDAAGADKVSDAKETRIETTLNEEFWNKKKSLRIGYDFHTFQNATGGKYPVRLGIGLSNNQNVWLHRKPLAGMVKFAFDHGIDLNYSLFRMQEEKHDYSGPSGYLGSSSLDYYEEEEMPMDLSKIGMHYVSVGYALGASVTVNPVSKMRVSGYFHFVPSAALFLSGYNLGVGFMPYCKYGVEVSYDRFGLGFEWGSGVSNMSDLMAGLMSESPDTEAPKSRYYSNYGRIYLAIRLAKKKRK